MKVKIRSLKPNVTRDEALRHFTAGAVNRAVELVRGPVQSIAQLYIPYRLFRVKFTNSGREESHIFALDAVQGTLDLYQFTALPSDAELLTLETRNVLSSNLSSTHGRNEVISKVRRQIFTKGFFRLRDVEFDAEPLDSDLCVPYWVCFRGSIGRAHLSVLDAIRRRPEGAKVRRLIEDWLCSQST